MTWHTSGWPPPPPLAAYPMSSSLTGTSMGGWGVDLAAEMGNVREMVYRAVGHQETVLSVEQASHDTT